MNTIAFFSSCFGNDADLGGDDNGKRTILSTALYVK